MQVRLAGIGVSAVVQKRAIRSGLPTEFEHIRAVLKLATTSIA